MSHAELVAFVESMVSRARARGRETPSCAPPVGSPEHGRFESWSVCVDVCKHNDLEHWSLSLKLIPNSSTEKDWTLLGKLVASFEIATGYPKDAPEIEPVMPLEEASPTAIHWWLWHSDGSDIDPVVEEMMYNVVSSRMPRDPQAVRPSTPRRNDPCSCGSGKKFKKCHGGN